MSALRGHCRCGAAQIIVDGPYDAAEDAKFELNAGLFPDTASFALISEIYVDQAPSYARLKGDHPRTSAADYQASIHSSKEIRHDHI
jgi:hypothetical protein